jgi:hypothetical protein
MKSISRGFTGAFVAAALMAGVSGMAQAQETKGGLPGAFSANVAKQYIDKETVFGSPDYVEWNIGLGYSIAGFDLSLNYSDTDISPSVDGKAEAVLFSVSRSF